MAGVGCDHRMFPYAVNNKSLSKTMYWIKLIVLVIVIEYLIHLVDLVKVVALTSSEGISES